MTGENRPSDGEFSEPKQALWEFLMGNIARMGAEKDQHQAFYNHMQQDAQVFAETMRRAGARTDTAVDRVLIKPGTIFRDAQYRKDNYPMWIIRDKTRYGGSSMDHVEDTSYAHRPITHYDFRFISVLQSGELVVCRSHDRPDATYKRYTFWPGRPGGVGDFVDRGVFDVPGNAASTYEQWVDDLKAATVRYVR